MKARIFVVISAALVSAGAFFVTSAVAQTSGSDPIAAGKRALANYSTVNEKTAACMHQKGFLYNASLSKADITDAFGLAGKTDSRDVLPIEVQSLMAQAVDDPNATIVSGLSPADQATWASAVNDCSAQVDLAAAGGPTGLAKVEALMRAAKGS